MILNASQRAGGMALGKHLLNATDNERVEIHEVRGFVSETVLGAMKEAEALSRGTHCRQYLFSLSLSPPETENVRAEVFEKALDLIEERLGLQGQPRVVVFHEKEGRRHAHAVWARIDADTGTARQMSFFKSKLRDVSRQLFLENGWQMPKGLMDAAARDPRNFTLEEWQQAKRAGYDAKATKGAIQECWAVSDNAKAFSNVLEERGLFLAKGTRRGYVVVTVEGEVLSLSRALGQTTKAVGQRLDEASGLRTLDETKAHIGAVIAPRLADHIRQAKTITAKAMKPLQIERVQLQQRHGDERQGLDEKHRTRFEREARERATRIRKGFAGLWDLVTGERAKMLKKNELEAHFCLQRDRTERDELVLVQMGERRALQSRIKAMRREHASRLLLLYRDASRYRQMGAELQSKRNQGFDLGR